MYSQADFDKIKKVILEEMKPSLIILFGSYASGNQTDNSDIDIMILTDHELSRKEKLEMIFTLQKRFLYLPYSVDILVKSTEDFDNYRDYIGTVNYEVARTGKVIWTKN